MPYTLAAWSASVKLPTFWGTQRHVRCRLQAASVVASLNIIALLFTAQPLPAQPAGGLFPATDLDRNLGAASGPVIREELPPTIAKPAPVKPPHPHRPETAEPAAPLIQEIPGPATGPVTGPGIGAEIAPGTGPILEQPIPGGQFAPPGVSQPYIQPSLPSSEIPPADGSFTPQHGGFYGDEVIQDGGVIDNNSQFNPGGTVEGGIIYGPTHTSPAPLVGPADAGSQSVVLPEISPLGAPPATTIAPEPTVRGSWAPQAAAPLLPSARPYGVTLETLIDRTRRISPRLQAAAELSRSRQTSQRFETAVVLPAAVAAPPRRVRRWGCDGNCQSCWANGPCGASCGSPCAAACARPAFSPCAAACANAGGGCNGGGCAASCGGFAGRYGRFQPSPAFVQPVSPGIQIAGGFDQVSAEAAMAREEFRRVVAHHLQAVTHAYWSLAHRRRLLVQQRHAHGNALAALQSGHTPDAVAAAAAARTAVNHAHAAVLHAQNHLLTLVGDTHLLNGCVEIIPTSPCP